MLIFCRPPLNYAGIRTPETSLSAGAAEFISSKSQSVASSSPHEDQHAASLDNQSRRPYQRRDQQSSYQRNGSNEHRRNDQQRSFNNAGQGQRQMGNGERRPMEKQGFGSRNNMGFRKQNRDDSEGRKEHFGSKLSPKPSSVNCDIEPVGSKDLPSNIGDASVTSPQVVEIAEETAKPNNLPNRFAKLRLLKRTDEVESSPSSSASVPEPHHSNAIDGNNPTAHVPSTEKSMEAQDLSGDQMSSPVVQEARTAVPSEVHIENGGQVLVSFIQEDSVYIRPVDEENMKILASLTMDLETYCKTSTYFTLQL